MFLMPSRFEPCGLNQMYSLRYGTVPVVRGGRRAGRHGRRLRAAGRQRTGFVFADYTPEALLEALQRALAAFREPRQLAGAAAGRHAAGPFLGPFSPGVRQNI